MQPETPQRQPLTGRRAAGLAALSASLLVLLLSGCSEIALLQPKGPIGASELSVIGISFALMLIVVIPVVVMAIWFPRRYRADHPRPDYDPAWRDSARLDALVWLVPAVIVLVLGTLTWRESHRLDPSVPIASGVPPLDVEVVSLDWKWLFIYPRLGVASVNELVIPAGTPVSFRLTSDSVLTSFFIPQLGSQIYAMAGMQSRLNLMADTPGVYAGQNQQFSGRGFAEMHFKVRAVTAPQFADWLQAARRSGRVLDEAAFRELSTPGAAYPVALYSRVSPGLFDGILRRYRESGAAHAGMEGS